MKLPEGVEVCLIDEYVFRDVMNLDVTEITEVNQYSGTYLGEEITEASHCLGALHVGKATIDVKVDSAVANRIFAIAIDRKSGAVQLKRDLAKDQIMGLAVETGSNGIRPRCRWWIARIVFPPLSTRRTIWLWWNLMSRRPGWCGFGKWRSCHSTALFT